MEWCPIKCSKIAEQMPFHNPIDSLPSSFAIAFLFVLRKHGILNILRQMLSEQKRWIIAKEDETRSAPRLRQESRMSSTERHRWKEGESRRTVASFRQQPKPCARITFQFFLDSVSSPSSLSASCRFVTGKAITRRRSDADAMPKSECNAFIVDDDDDEQIIIKPWTEFLKRATSDDFQNWYYEWSEFLIKNRFESECLTKSFFASSANADF